MKHRIMTLGVGFAIVAALVATGQVAGQESQPPKAEEMTLTGCVVQGTAPTVFILENAKVDRSDRTQKGRSYILVSSVATLSFGEHLNHEVTVTGVTENKLALAPRDDEKVKEADLPKLKATKLVQVATTCS